MYAAVCLAAEGLADRVVVLLLTCSLDGCIYVCTVWDGALGEYLAIKQDNYALRCGGQATTALHSIIYGPCPCTGSILYALLPCS